MNALLTLFWTFARIGGLTFGGGYAMLPMLQREIVEHHGWATEEELADYYAVGQCTPGVIAVNTATFIGYKQRGILGGIAATLGVGEAMLNGLSEIYNKIDTDTHTILSAVNSNGQKILRAIDKQTGEIKQFIAEDGDKTRFQQFLNTLDIMDHTSWRIDGVHRHIDERGHWIEQKIDEAREDVNEYNRKQHEETREHISTEFEDHSLRSRLRRLFR